MNEARKSVLLSKIPRSLYTVLPRNAVYFKHPSLLGCIGIRVNSQPIHTITPQGLYAMAKVLKDRGVECTFHKRSAKTGRAKLVVGDWVLKSSKRSAALDLDIAYIEYVPSLETVH